MFFQHLRNTVPLLAPMVSDEKCVVIYIVFPKQWRCRFSLAFFFVFSFQKSWYRFLWLGPIWGSLRFGEVSSHYFCTRFLSCPPSLLLRHEVI